MVDFIIFYVVDRKLFISGNFCFLLFWGIEMYTNAVETKEK